MGTPDQLRAQLLAGMRSEDDGVRIESARGLLALQEYGDPTGTFLLEATLAANRLNRFADAVFLTYHGMKVAQPGSLVWGEILVNRAQVCALVGYLPEAITAGQLFLERVETLPEKARSWIPHAHLAVAQAYDRMHHHGLAVPHHRVAATLFTDPEKSAIATCNLAYSTALTGHPQEAMEILQQVEPSSLPTHGRYVHASSMMLICHLLGRHEDALRAGDEADKLAEGNEDRLANPLTEMHLWMSMSAFALGDRYRAGALGLYAAFVATRIGNTPLRDRANAWLEEIMRQGGIHNA
ncbi:MAG TPA: hypothetical protein VGK74_19690 [Symbiobacteriaceae bacterium]|jgi:hypothetical protein